VAPKNSMLNTNATESLNAKLHRAVRACAVTPGRGGRVPAIRLCRVDHLIHSRWESHSFSGQDTQNAMLNEIVEYHAIYARGTQHLAEVLADRNDHIKEWLGDRLSREFHVPDLSSMGLALVGARLLGITRQTVAQG
jgi:anti-sigma factor RsiW